MHIAALEFMFEVELVDIKKDLSYIAQQDAHKLIVLHNNLMMIRCLLISASTLSNSVLLTLLLSVTRCLISYVRVQAKCFALLALGNSLS